MGLLSNRLDRGSLRPGDHIYSWRTAYVYAHHGIYIGDNKVIHFTRHGQEVGTGTVLDVILVSSAPRRFQIPCTTCTHTDDTNGVVSSCLNCFLAGGVLYRFEYSVSLAVFLAKARGGTCTIAVSDPPETVVHRANYLLNNGFGCYNVFKNNCEDFAIYCKTGRNQSTMGQSGQVVSIIGGHLAAVLSTSLMLVTTNVYGMAATAVSVYCGSRYAADKSHLLCDQKTYSREDQITKRKMESSTNNSSTLHFPMSINQIQLLNGSNFKKWKADIELNLGILDYDHVLKDDPPAALTQASTKEQKDQYDRWMKHNKMALIMIKKSMTENVRGSIPNEETAKQYLASIEEKCKVSDKAETNNLMKALLNMEYKGENVREFIMKGSDIANKLKELNMTMDDSFLVYMLLNKLPDAYDNLRSLYKTQKEIWTVNELISLCADVEDEIKKKGKTISVNAISKEKKTWDKGSTSKFGTKNDKNKHKGKKPMKCFFCKKKGHFKKDCEGFKARLEKRGIVKEPNPKQE